MRKIISLLFILVLSVNAFALKVYDQYTVEAPLASVYTTTTTCVAAISDDILVKQIIITNGSTAQTVDIYSVPVDYSTTTVSTIATLDIPASTVVYYPSNVLDDESIIKFSDFAVATSTDTNPCNVTMIYKEV